MARWTKKGAISRMNDNSLLQEAMQVEPMLRPIIEEAKRQRNISGYNRIRKYVGLRNRAMRFVGTTAENEKLRANKYYDAVRGAIDDLLPPDDTDLYPDGKPSTAKAAKRRIITTWRDLVWWEKDSDDQIVAQQGREFHGQVPLLCGEVWRGGTGLVKGKVARLTPRPADRVILRDFNITTRIVVNSGEVAHAAPPAADANR